MENKSSGKSMNIDKTVVDIFEGFGLKVKDSTTIVENVMDTLYSRGGQKLYDKYLKVKEPGFSLKRTIQEF